MTAGLLLAVVWANTGQAYNSYGDGCSATGCHGDFRSSTSPKGTVFPLGKNHKMHRDGAALATDFELCHTGPDRTPVYTNGYTLVHDPGNTAQVANTNENWSVGDFVGLDNDGNGLADLADYTIGPFRLVSAVPEGSNLRVTWLTAGGRTNTVQAAGNAET